MDYTQEQNDQIMAEQDLGTTFTNYWKSVFEQIDQMGASQPYRVRRVKDLIEQRAITTSKLG
jgi:hypothetical protein